MLFFARAAALDAVGGSIAWLPAAAAFILGFAAEFVNYSVTKAVLARGASASFVIPLRALFAAVCMVLCFLAANFLGVSPGPLLIACAVGLSVGLALFTALMIRSARGAGRDDRAEGEEGGDR